MTKIFYKGRFVKDDQEGAMFTLGKRRASLTSLSCYLRHGWCLFIHNVIVQIKTVEDDIRLYR